MLRLKRYLDAQQLLHECHTVFESDGGDEELGKVYSALADLEDELHHYPEAIRYESIALRYRYSVFAPSDCAISHFNLALYMGRNKADPGESLAHRFASVFIAYQTNKGGLRNDLNALTAHLAEVDAADIPKSFAEVCDLVEQIEGVRFRELFAHLPQRSASGEDALQAVLELAHAAKAEAEMPEWLQALRAAAARGEDIEPTLAYIQEQLTDTPQGAEFMTQLRAMIAKAKSTSA